MNTKELLKGYAQFDGAEWWPMGVKFMKHKVCGELEFYAIDPSDNEYYHWFLDAHALLIIRGAAVEWLTDNCFPLSKCGGAYDVMLNPNKYATGKTIDEAIIAALKELEK